MSAGQIVSGSSSCGERTLPHLYSSLPQAVAPPRCAPPGRRPPPWAQSAGHRLNRLPKPLVSFGASSSSRRTKPRPKPCPGAHFRATPASLVGALRRAPPRAGRSPAGLAYTRSGPSDRRGRHRLKEGAYPFGGPPWTGGPGPRARSTAGVSSCVTACVSPASARQTAACHVAPPQLTCRPPW
jgi:hypothetical protein